MRSITNELSSDLHILVEMDTLISLLFHCDVGPCQFGPIEVVDPLYRITSKQSDIDVRVKELNILMTSLDLPNSFAGVEELRACLKIYQRSRDEAAEQKKVFSFDVGQWIDESKMAKEWMRHSKLNYCTAYESRMNTYETILIHWLRDCVKIEKKAVSDKAAPEKVERTPVTPITPTTSSVSPFVITEELRKAIASYNKSKSESKNDGKYFSVETKRWGKATKKGLHIDESYRVYGTTTALVNEFIRALNTLVPSSTGISGGTTIRVSVKTDRLLLPTDVKEPTTPKEKKDSWATTRTELWFYEQKRNAKWGIPSEFNGNEGKCFACGKDVTITKSNDGPGFEAGHIWPRKYDGTDDVDNLRVCCWECNRGSDGMATEHAYHWVVRHNKPGIKNIGKRDPSLLMVKLLLQQQAICEALLAEKRMKLTTEEANSLKPGTNILDRIDTLQRVFKRLLPSVNLPSSDRPTASGEEAVTRPRAKSESKCCVM